MVGVELDQDLVGEAEVGVGGADGGGQDDAAAGGDVASLGDGEVHGAEEAIADDLGNQRQVHVDKTDFAGVDLFAQSGAGLVGGAEADGVGFGQGGVEALAGGSAGEDADLKLASGLMFTAGLDGEGGWNGLGRTGGRKAAETDGGAVRG